MNFSVLLIVISPSIHLELKKSPKWVVYDIKLVTWIVCLPGLGCAFCAASPPSPSLPDKTILEIGHEIKKIFKFVYGTKTRVCFTFENGWNGVYNPGLIGPWGYTSRTLGPL